MGMVRAATEARTYHARGVVLRGAAVQVSWPKSKSVSTNLNKVRVSIVLNINSTFLKKGIPIHPVHSEYRALYRVLYCVRYRVRIFKSTDIVYAIVYDDFCNMESCTVLSVCCLNNDSLDG